MEPVNDQQRKYAAAALVFLSVVIVIVAVRGVSSSVRSLSSGDISDEPLVVDQEQLIALQLQQQDTDTDGLNDFDELNLYFTSPYLVDSDSDGISDKEEVDSGKDPNCPGGQDCYGAILEGGQEYDPSNAPTPLVLDPLVAETLKGVLPENPSPDDIRGLLRSQGATESTINSLSDEALLENYRQAYDAL